jgi:acetyltransferase-like isoleucine patch superfamily enzyme
MGGEIVIEDDVLIGPGVHFYTSNHFFSKSQLPISYQGYPPATIDDSILIKRGAWIGASTIILPGVIIGENAVVGAGTIVSKAVPPYTVFAGNPGKILKIVE